MRKRLDKGRAGSEKRDMRKKDGRPGLMESQALEEKLSRPVTSMKLGKLHKPIASRALNSLESSGVKTLGDLVKLSEDELRRMRFFGGDKTVKAVKNYLRLLGLSLAPSEDEKRRLAANLVLHINKTGLSDKVKEVLDAENVKVVVQLVQMPEEELLRMRGIGPKAVTEIKEALSGLGLKHGTRVSGLGLAKQFREAIDKIERKAARLGITPNSPGRAWASMDDEELLGRAKAFIDEKRIANRGALKDADASLHDVLGKRNLLKRFSFTGKARDLSSMSDEEVLDMAYKLVVEKNIRTREQILEADAGLYQALRSRKLLDAIQRGVGQRVSVGGEAPQKTVAKEEPSRQGPKMLIKEGLVLETDLSLDEMKTLVDKARWELNKLLDTVKPNLVDNVRALLDALQFQKPPGEA